MEGKRKGAAWCVCGGLELSHGLLENVICDGVVLQGVVVHNSFAFAPAGRRAALFIAEYFGEMAQRPKARRFGDFKHFLLRTLFHAALGKFDTQVGNPVAEIDMVNSVDVFGEIGAVGAKLVRQIFESQTRLSESLLLNPFIDAFF